MFIHIINSSIAASWLILAVIVLRLLLKRAPRWITCLLWAMVGVRLVCPISIKSILSLVPSGETVPTTIEYDAVPQINSGISSLNSAVNPVLSDHFAATPQYSANPMQILVATGQYIWLIGAGIMLVYLLVSYAVLRLRMRTATVLQDNIMQSERVTSPFVMGIVRPRIYLPYNLDEQPAVHVIAHEQAHIARGDHIVKPLAFLVLTLHWFNPLVWAAYILLCRDIEMACDQRVIKSLDSEKRKDYSRALVHGSTRPTAAACPLAFGEVGVKTRVKSVLSYKKPALWIIIAAVIVCAITAVCFLTDPVDQHEPFGRRYHTVELVYQSPMLSSIGQPGQQYRITADRRLVIIGEEDISCGRLEEVTLSKDNFDELTHVHEGAGWSSGHSAAGLRRDNQSAWQLVTDDDTLYYILIQNSGELYIAQGWHDTEGETDPYSDDSSILRIFRMDEMSETGTTDLDEAINSAAIKENRGKYLSGSFACSAHTLLAAECETIDQHTERLTAYAIVLYQEYNLVDGVPEDVSGSSCPAALTFDITADGQYTLVEYWTPGVGTKYAVDLEAKFPDGVSWNTANGNEQRMRSCYSQACDFFGISATTSDTGGADDSAVTIYTTQAYVVDSSSALEDISGMNIGAEMPDIVYSDGRIFILRGTFGLLAYDTAAQAVLYRIPYSLHEQLGISILTAAASADGKQVYLGNMTAVDAGYTHVLNTDSLTISSFDGALPADCFVASSIVDGYEDMLESDVLNRYLVGWTVVDCGDSFWYTRADTDWSMSSLHLVKHHKATGRETVYEVFPDTSAATPTLFSFSDGKFFELRNDD